MTYDINIKISAPLVVMTPAVMTALADLAIIGDRAAFVRLYNELHPRLIRYARRRCGDPEIAKDAMQDSAMTMARNIHRLSDPAALSPWAYTIVRRRVADRMRKLPPAGEDITDDLANPARGISAEDTLTTRDILRALSPADRELLTLFYIDGLTGAELAAALDVPAGTIKSRLFRIREAFKLQFTQTNFTPKGD